MVLFSICLVPDGQEIHQDISSAAFSKSSSLGRE
jgi:hypothetical protein